MTPFSISIVAGNSVAGAGITFLKRCRPVTVLGALIMGAGGALLAQMTPATGFLQVAAFVVVAGLGMGILFTATSVAVQNTLPPAQLGAGFGAVRYIGQIGGILGVALVGTVVNNSLQRELSRRVGPQALNHLASQGVKLAAGPQALVNPAYRQSLVHGAVRRAVAGVSPGRHHDAMVAILTRQELHLLNGAFQALRLSLATAVQRGLLTALLFCCAALVAAFFVTDPPMTGRSGASSEGVSAP